MNRLPFQLEAVASGSLARAGRMQTPHGEVLTPVFMPVGTHATVRSQTLGDLRAAGFRILLANAYYLSLRPGADVFRKFGGLHRFMGWDGAVLTDSGGFQVFSLAGRREVREEGVSFRPEPDAGSVLLTPESCIQAQLAIGSDIAMPLDVCVPATCERKEAEEALERTLRWAERCLEARGDQAMALFGIAQGAVFGDLRARAARAVTSLDFDGFAIGGLAVGETRAQREDATAWVTELLPRDRPRYLMGVGTPLDLLEAVHRGVDLFDCIIPTAWAQRGSAFTLRGKIDLRRGAHRLSDEPIEAGCPCPACASHSRGYLRHLVKSGEILAWQLIGAHNLLFYSRLMRELRQAILEDRFLSTYRELRESLALREEDLSPPRARRKRRRPEELGDFRVARRGNGAVSIEGIRAGEVMHPGDEPSEEARALYVEQSRLLERLPESPLVVWDVGLGAGTNAMAAIRAALEREASIAGLEVVSFENDLDALRLALLRRDLFAHVRHPAPASLLGRGSWESRLGRVRWRLIEGDFRATWRQAPAPDLVYYDLFSPKTDCSLWSPSLFRQLAQEWKDRRVELFTYSCSTSVRASLLAAGFGVGVGAPTGPKAETTVAWTGEAARPGLSSSWLRRWERSSARVPPGLARDEAAAFEESVRSHPQFLQGTREA